jgi:hypothetical protein
LSPGHIGLEDKSDRCLANGESHLNTHTKPLPGFAEAYFVYEGKAKSDCRIRAEADQEKAKTNHVWGISNAGYQDCDCSNSPRHSDS